MFGATFTIDQITSINYQSVAGNAGGEDFYVTIYTPYDSTNTTCNQPDTTKWYCHRLTGEPIYADNYSPTANWWDTWTTAAGINQLTLNNSNASGNYGFYNQPTLQDIQAGVITWSTLISGGSTIPIDYRPENVLCCSFSTGSSWTSFAGYLDWITIALSNGEVYQINLETFTSPVYVDDNWAGSPIGSEVETGKFFGWNAFAKKFRMASIM